MPVSNTNVGGDLVFKMIDPACGSGHFLLGSFPRIFSRWREREPALGVRDLVQRTLNSIHDDAQIVRLTVEKHPPDPDDPHAEVVLQHVPAPIGQAGFRTCLKCDNAFASDGPGNRICPACREIKAVFSHRVEDMRGRKFHNGEPMDERQEDRL